jgi:DNA polymerase-3 subunit epsilon
LTYLPGELFKVDFISVDVETANYFRGSICQVGLTTVRENKVQGTETILINPQVEFDTFNVDLHGIDANVVEGAPTFAEI